VTESQEDHLARIKAQFLVDVDAKYRRGAREHGNDLLEHSPVAILEMLIEEALDQYVYAASLKEAMQRRCPPL
jgi:hypothetical protein